MKAQISAALQPLLPLIFNQTIVSQKPVSTQLIHTSQQWRGSFRQHSILVGGQHQPATAGTATVHATAMAPMDAPPQTIPSNDPQVFLRMAAGKTGTVIHYDITDFANLARLILLFIMTSPILQIWPPLLCMKRLWGMVLVELSWCGTLTLISQSSSHSPSCNGLLPTWP